MTQRGVTPPGADEGAATRIRRRTLLKGAAVGAGALLLDRSGVALAGNASPNALLPLRGAGVASTSIGPSTTTAPYALPSLAQGVDIVSILTVGDRADNSYRMVGIPDGLGAMRNPRGGARDDEDEDTEDGFRFGQPTGPGDAPGRAQTFSLFINHELGSAAGIPRAHGSTGAFVSKWTIDRRTLRVLAGEDLTSSPNHVHQWNAATGQYFLATTQWNRLCSADLPARKALRHGNRGTSERIFCDGEEVTFGRAWARIATGPGAGHAWDLPRLGKMAHENVVACPHGKDKTIVALTDDGSVSTAPNTANNNNPSEVFVYVGTKQREGSEIERAGLTNGKFYGVRVRRNDNTLVTEESNDFGIGNSTTGYVGSGRFELVELGNAGDVSSMTGLQIEQDAIAKNVFRLQRPEDSAWDPRGSGKDDLYFVTTASISPLLNSRLWRLKFDDINRPEQGGRIEIVLTNTPGRMFDNLTIDRLGRILLQEDTGNNPWVAKIWLYGIDTGALVEVAHHDPALFEPGGARFITQDEESSGIIDAAHILGEGWFLFDVQVHKAATDAELVEGGQLLAMYVHPRIGWTR
jgi:hypothetical protein